MCHVPFAFGFLISLAKIVLPHFPSLGFRSVFDLVFYRCLLPLGLFFTSVVAAFVCGVHLAASFEIWRALGCDSFL